MTSAFQRTLSSACWPRSAADLAAIGVNHSATRGKRWRKTSRGFFVPAGQPESTTQRILDAAPLVPAGGALAGWAAAYVFGVDSLDGLDPHSMSRLAVTISLGRDSGRLDTDQVIFVRDRLPTAHHTVRHGISVTTPERTAFDGARWASSLVEAVVFLDQVTHALAWTSSWLRSRAGAHQAVGGRASASFGRPSRWPTPPAPAHGSPGCGCSTCSRRACPGPT